MLASLQLRRIAIGIALGVCAAAQAADWPDRAGRVIVPYGPGGGVDTFTRPIVHRLTEQLGQSFVVLNRAGAGGTIGVKMAAQSPPDGYTLLGGGVHQPMAEPLYPKRDYDFGKDFVPIAVTAAVPNVLVVHSTPSVKEAWKTQGAHVPSMRLEELGPFVRDEIAKWASVIKKAGIAAE